MGHSLESSRPMLNSVSLTIPKPSNRTTHGQPHNVHSHVSCSCLLPSAPHPNPELPPLSSPRKLCLKHHQTDLALLPPRLHPLLNLQRGAFARLQHHDHVIGPRSAQRRDQDVVPELRPAGGQAAAAAAVRAERAEGRRHEQVGIGRQGGARAGSAYEWAGCRVPAADDQDGEREGDGGVS